MTPLLELLSHCGHCKLPALGFPDTAIAVQAAIRFSLIANSAGVEVQAPLEIRGWLARFPKIMGISEVCVAPIRASASSGGKETHGQEGVCWLV